MLSVSPILHALVFSVLSINSGGFLSIVILNIWNGKSSVNVPFFSAVRMWSCLPQRTHLQSVWWGRVEHQRGSLHLSSLSATVPNQGLAPCCQLIPSLELSRTSELFSDMLLYRFCLMMSYLSLFLPFHSAQHSDEKSKVPSDAVNGPLEGTAMDEAK